MESQLFLNESDAAWQQVGSRLLMIRLSADGRCMGEAGNSTLAEKAVLLDKLVGKGVAGCFDLKGQQNLTALSENRRLLHCRQGVFPADIETDFITNLPVYALTLNSRGSDGFLGVISPIRVAPNVRFHESGGIVYADRQGRICGYNTHFHQMLKAVDGRRVALLDALLDDLLEPSPFALARKAVALDRSHAGTALSGRYEAGPSGISRLPSFPLCGQWTELEMTYEVSDGQAPVVRLLDDASEVYLLGPSAARSDTVVVKKLGCVVADGARIGLSATGRHRLLWRICNGTFRLWLDGTERFAFHDFDCRRDMHVNVEVAWRKGSRGVLSPLVMRTGAAGYILPEGPSIVRLKAGPNRAFVMHRVYHPVLASVFPEVTAYVFHDVSRLERDVNRFSRLYKAEQADADRLRKKLSAGTSEPVWRLVGESPAMRRVRSQAELLAASDATVLIEGETGSGKEVMAAYLHRLSGFADGPFVKVDCSSLPGALLESELFGVEKGAFTGAHESRAGKFEQAEGGTLFLDEVNNLPLNVQAKLLGFLQDLTVTRLGGSKAKKLKVRIIAASNLPLADMVGRGLFRKDLYYRICVAAITLPPLRERREDIPELAGYFLRALSGSKNLKADRFSPAALERLVRWDWPGNVRELRNEIQRAVIFATGSVVEAADLSIKAANDTPDKSGKATPPKLALSRDAFERMLQKHGGNLNAVARELGCARSSVYYNLRKWGLAPVRFRGI